MQISRPDADRHRLHTHPQPVLQRTELRQLADSASIAAPPQPQRLYPSQPHGSNPPPLRHKHPQTPTQAQPPNYHPTPTHLSNPQSALPPAPGDLRTCMCAHGQGHGPRPARTAPTARCQLPDTCACVYVSSCLCTYYRCTALQTYGLQRCRSNAGSTAGGKAQERKSA